MDGEGQCAYTIRRVVKPKAAKALGFTLPRADEVILSSTCGAYWPAADLVNPTLDTEHERLVLGRAATVAVRPVAVLGGNRDRSFA